MRMLKVLLLLMVGYTTVSSTAFCQGNPLQARTGHLRLEKTTTLNALLALAQDVNVPFGISCADQQLRTKEISFQSDQQTLNEALSAIAAAQPGLTFHAAHGVVVVERVPRPPECDFLNTVIPEFVIQRDTIEHVNAKLWMTLEMILDPSRTGFSGILHPNPKEMNIGPAELRNVTVADILNWIVAQHSAAAWVGWPCKNVKSASNEQLWQIVFYKTN